MTGITIPKSWFKKKNSKKCLRHSKASNISSPSTVTGSSIPSRPRQTSTSSTGSSPLALETTMTMTNRSSTGMTAVSSSSIIFPGPSSPPSQGYSPASSSSPSLPYSCSSAHATSTAHINQSQSSLPSRQSQDNKNKDNKDNTIDNQGPPPATKPPSSRLEQLNRKQPPHIQNSESSRAINGYPTAQISASHAHVHPVQGLGHASPCHAPQQPKTRFLERSYTQKYQPNKILRNLSARFGSSTDLPVVDTPETVAQEYARTIKALWRMVEEEELSQRMADATPAEREWIILHNTTFPFTDVTMTPRESISSSTHSSHRFSQGQAHVKHLPPSQRHPIYNNHPSAFHDSKIHLQDLSSNSDPSYYPPISSNSYINPDNNPHRFSTQTTSSVGPEDASFHGDTSNRFTLLSEASTTTVSTEAMNRDLRSRSQDWYQQQLQEHGYQGYTNYVHRFHPQGSKGYELESLPLARIEDDEGSEDESIARERKRKELEELEQELNVLGLQRYSHGPYYEEMGCGHYALSDDDEGVIGVARKVPVRDSLRL
ncbi:hypothetical protein MVEG_08241 [Podila verticillata NRRL 6337]|nr:hypothetical protein MVEG_08241 [Podila verticillata NRRL 6337]